MKAKYKIGQTVFSKSGKKYGDILKIYYAPGEIYYRIKFFNDTETLLVEESDVSIEEISSYVENLRLDIETEGDNVRVKMYIEDDEKANISAPRENKTITKTIESAINALVTLSNIAMQEAEK